MVGLGHGDLHGGAVAEAAGGLLILGLGARPEVRLEVERVQRRAARQGRPSAHHG